MPTRASVLPIADSGGGVQLRDVIGDTTEESVQQMKELIDENTR